MAASSKPPPGRFVWHDLMTSDVEAAKRFYSGVFGWTFVGSQEPGNPYVHLESKGVMFGGMIPLPKPEVPPHWMAYVEVDDVGACIERAQRAGGTVALPARDIPGVGRFAVLLDPTGAHFAPFHPSAPHAPESDAVADMTFCWDELLTTDPARSTAFYGEVLGWRVQDVPMGALGTYYLFKRGAKDAGGMLPKPAGAPGPSQWLAYVAVADVDQVARRIGELRGKLLVPPSDIPGVGRFAVAMDPLGACFAIYRRLPVAA